MTSCVYFYKKLKYFRYSFVNLSLSLNDLKFANCTLFYNNEICLLTVFFGATEFSQLSLPKKILFNTLPVITCLSLSLSLILSLAHAVSFYQRLIISRQLVHKLYKKCVNGGNFRIFFLKWQITKCLPLSRINWNYATNWNNIIRLCNIIIA